jgi:hypothetical protein
LIKNKATRSRYHFTLGTRLRSLKQVIEWRGQPHAIRCDNGPEYPRGHGAVTGCDGIDFVAQLGYHQLQVSQALRIKLAFRLLSRDFCREPAPAQEEDFPGARHFGVFREVVHQPSSCCVTSVADYRATDVTCSWCLTKP